MSTGDDEISRAPWSADEVRNLEAWQACRWVHPYTCGPCRDADGYPPTDEHRLVPTINGWRCRTCDLRQNWCYRPMLSGPPPLLETAGEGGSIITDPVERVLSAHQCINLPDYRRCCLCGELFENPSGYRRHVAELIYEALDLAGSSD